MAPSQTARVLCSGNCGPVNGLGKGEGGDRGVMGRRGGRGGPSETTSAEHSRLAEEEEVEGL